MISTERGLFNNDKEGQILNQEYRYYHCLDESCLYNSALIFNKIVRHLQKHTIYSISQIINRFIIENDDLSNIKRHVLVAFLDLDNYIRYKRRL